MKTALVPALAACCVVAACSNQQGLLHDRSGKIRAAACSSGDEVVAAQKLLERVDVVIVLDGDDETQFAQLTSLAAKAAKTPIVACYTLPPSREPVGPFGNRIVVQGQDGAAAAVDIALLICNGISVPASLPLGCVTTTKGAAEGQARAAPGDFILAMLRQQHAATLTTTPDTDEAHPIALLLTTTDSEWQQSIRTSATQAMQRYPQLNGKVVVADDTPEAQAEAAQRLIDEGCRVMLVTSDHAQAIVATAAATKDQLVDVVVFDPLAQTATGTCTIGIDQRILGAAAAAVFQQLLGDTGSILELRGDPNKPWLKDRHQGFVDGLGLRQP